MSERERDKDEAPPPEPAALVHDGGDPQTPATGVGEEARDPGAPEAPAPGEERDLPELDADAQEALDEVDMRDLLRAALAPPPGSVAPDLLHGVQRKLRRRSRGKFYGDGWSTARSPRSTYLFTSVLMLVLIGFVFLVLIPWGSGALP
jgi:hypothetical protein